MKKTQEGCAGMCLWENLRNAEITKSKFLFFVRSESGGGIQRGGEENRPVEAQKTRARPGRSTFSKGVGLRGWLRGLPKEGNPRASQAEVQAQLVCWIKRWKL